MWTIKASNFKVHYNVILLEIKFEPIKRCILPKKVNKGSLSKLKSLRNPGSYLVMTSNWRANLAELAQAFETDYSLTN